ncbi:MAG: DinB family protein [Bacteroidetes bacterium]|nr:DinB family protein [Bacteroidota bacterium]
MPLSISITGRLQHQHETISELIQGFSETQLKERIIPEKWSAFENITHLAAYQPTFIYRLKLMIDGQKPKFERYVADNDPLFHEYLKKSLEELLKDISAKRIIITDSLARLNDEELKLVGHHPKFGYTPIYKWADFYLLHEAHHLFTIMQLIGALQLRQQ